MIELNWDPVPHVGPIPINWYGLTFAVGLLVGSWLVYRWRSRYNFSREKIERLLVWIVIGIVAGARLSFVLQNDPSQYVVQPWRLVAIWEGGLAYFGGLFGAILGAFVYLRRQHLPFAAAADLFAPAIPIGSAIGRIGCGLAGMDYGTQTSLPWGIVYSNPNSYAPNDGIARHPTQFYELFADLAIAGLLLRLRDRCPPGALFFIYLILFSSVRFLLFFVRGDVPTLAFGLKNGQWTALVILAISVPFLIRRLVRPGSPEIGALVQTRTELAMMGRCQDS